MLLLCWRGIDFGVYWDENNSKIDAVLYSIDNNFTLLPDWYLYPGVNYWLTVACLAPELTRLAIGHQLTIPTARPILQATLRSFEFRLRERRLYSFIASLTPVWVYFTIFVWRRTWPIALAGSLLVALSWEVIYQSRWIAADPIVMQFGALTMFLLFLFLRRRQDWFLYFASVSAALACGAKYPGGLLILPVLCAIWTNDFNWLRALKMMIASVSLFITVYLLSTPGTVLQPFKFYDSLEVAKNVYASGWYGYTVHPGISHLSRMFLYFASQLFSSNLVISLVLFTLVPFGVFAVVVGGPWKEALILLIFPATYLIYFSTQRAMIVRNYLVVVPFIAVLAATGLEWLQRRLNNRRISLGLTILIVALFSINAVQQLQASTSVLNRRDKGAFLRQFMQYITSHPGQRILISPALEITLREQGFWRGNLISQKQAGLSSPFDVYASYYSETVSPRSWEWVTNRPGTFLQVFGPREVNLSYYVGWWGDDRIILLTNAHFHKWRVDKPRLRSGP